MNGCMFRTDELVDMTIHKTMNVVKRISAKDINFIRVHELVGEFLDLNQRLMVAFRRQKIYAFAENRDSGAFDRCNRSCLQDEVAKHFPEPKRIRHAINHERRERLGRDNNSRVPSFESGSDKPLHVVYE